jgi:hypothetical protein
VELRPLAAAAEAAAAAAPAVSGSGVFLRAGECHAGELAFMEAPFAATAAAACRLDVPSCAHCLRPLPGPLALHARAQTHGAEAAALPELPPLPLAADSADDDACCACPLGCDDAFCSARCRDAACGVDGWHALLCSAQLDEAHPLRLFEEHARATSDLFTLAGRTLAAFLAQACAAGGTREATAAAMERLQVRGSSAVTPVPPHGCPSTHVCSHALLRLLPLFSRASPLPRAGAAAAGARHVVGLRAHARGRRNRTRRGVGQRWPVLHARARRRC